MLTDHAIDVLMIRVLALYHNGELLPDAPTMLSDDSLRQETDYLSVDTPYTRGDGENHLHCYWRKRSGGYVRSC